jgi:hypothetical protein
MTDISPEAAPPQANNTRPEPPFSQGPHGRAGRALSHPLVRVTATVVGLALGWGVFHAAHTLWASRNDNTPVSSSTHAPSGALRVSGRGVTLTFPRGWVNVPTTPNELEKFLKAEAGKFPHLRAALKSQLQNMQNVRRFAMLVYRISPAGAITANTNVLVLPGTLPARRLMAQVKGTLARFGATHQRDSLTAFGKYAGVVVTYMVPRLKGRPAEYGAQAYIHGPASTTIITVTSVTAGDAADILRQIADTITFR